MTKLLSRLLRWRLALCLLPAPVFAQGEYPCDILIMDSSAWSPCGEVLEPGTIWGDAMGVFDELRMDFNYTSGTEVDFQLQVLYYRKPWWCANDTVLISARRRECDP